MGGMLKLITLPIRLPFEIWFSIIDTIEFYCEQAYSDAQDALADYEKLYYREDD